MRKYTQLLKSEEFGVIASNVELNFAKVQERKEKIVTQLHKGVQHLMKQGKIDVFEGIGRILGPSIFSPMPGTISVELASGEENEMLIPKCTYCNRFSSEFITGLELDGEYVMSSDHALKMETLPSSIIIVGGGVIGIEWASMLADFGVEVTVLEYAKTILPLEDQDVSKEMQRLFKKKVLKW